jgi:branched-chain amino acid transport system permease protein
MLTCAWGLASMVGTGAALLAANQLLLDPSMMQGVLLFAFAAAVLGGLTSPVGAVLGGLIMGVVNALAGDVSFIGSDLATVATFVVIVLILLIRPAGLLGKAAVVRV